MSTFNRSEDHMRSYNQGYRDAQEHGIELKILIFPLRQAQIKLRSYREHNYRACPSGMEFNALDKLITESLKKVRGE